MCLLVLAWNTHPHYRLVLAANRDEFHERSAAAMNWREEPQILAGRDLEAGGTWLGVRQNGRFGVVTNYRDLQRPEKGTLSRGLLIPDFLKGHDGAAEFTARIEPSLRRYSGFNLLVGDRTNLSYITNRAEPSSRSLGPGVFGLSNHLLDTPWPKLVRARFRFEQVLIDPHIDPDRLFEVLTDREPAVDPSAPESGLPRELERALSAPFVVNERFGTRCSTVLLIRHDGRMEVVEQSYDATGATVGRVSFNVSEQESA